MTARLVLPPDAPREEWLEARRQGVTASEIAVILGISPFDSPFNLYHRKLGLIPDQPDNDVLSLGRHLEPWIADRWAEDHPEFHLEPGGLWTNDDRPYQLATPDRLLHHYGDEIGGGRIEIAATRAQLAWVAYMGADADADRAPGDAQMTPRTKNGLGRVSAQAD